MEVDLFSGTIWIFRTVNHMVDSGTWAKLSPGEKAVLFVLIRRADATGSSFAGIASLAADAGLSRRQAQRSLASLGDKGLVTSTGREKSASPGYLTSIRQVVSPMTLPLVSPMTLPSVTHDTTLVTPMTPKGDQLEGDQLRNDRRMPHGERFRGAWRQWCEYLVQAGRKLTPMTASRQLAVLGEMSEDAAVSRIEQCISAGWRSLGVLTGQTERAQMNKNSKVDEVNRILRRANHE